MDILSDDMTQTLEATITIEPDNIVISTCKAHATQNHLTISGWYTTAEYQHKHFGTMVLSNVVTRFLQECVTDESKIIVDYNWNGQNAYVGKWLESMNAAKTENIADQKYNNQDTWNNHIYEIPWEALKKKLNISAI